MHPHVLVLASLSCVYHASEQQNPVREARQQHRDTSSFEFDMRSNSPGLLRRLAAFLMILNPSNAFLRLNGLHSAPIWNDQQIRSSRVAEVASLRVPTILALTTKRKYSKKKRTVKVRPLVTGVGFGAKFSDDVDPAWPDQAAWLRSQGGRADAVELAECAGGLRGMRATRDLKRGDVIVSVPESLIYGKEYADKSPVSRLWKGSEDELPTFYRLALGLLYEQRLGKDSRWSRYCDTLPSIEEFRECGPALFWTPPEIAICENEQITLDAQFRRNEIAGFPILSNSTFRAERWREFNLPGEPPGDDEMWWALACGTSRAFGDSGFTPLGDLINHDADTRNNAFAGKGSDGKGFLVLAKKDIKKGEQVFFCYAENSNIVLLRNGGFILPNNPHKQTLVHCGPELAKLLDPDVMKKQTLMNFDEGIPAEWQNAGPELREMLRVLASEMRLPIFLLMEVEDDYDDAESQSAAAYAILLRRSLASFSSSPAEARAEIDAEGSRMHPRRRLALEFRCEQQELLQKELASVEEELEKEFASTS